MEKKHCIWRRCENQINGKAWNLIEGIEDGELVELIYQVLEEYAKDIYLPLRMKMEFGRDLFNAFRKLDILQELLEDESITEIMINGLENIFVEKKGEIYQYEKKICIPEETGRHRPANCLRL